MSGMNLVVVEGHLRLDPELHELNPDFRTCTFKVMVHQESGTKDCHEYFNVKVERTLAEVCYKYLKENSHVLISGYLTKSYEGDTYIEGREVKFLPCRKEELI